MRDIFEEHKNGWIRLQQGAIFSGAIADGITGCQGLFGLIITPRCDIANKKVSTIHYLPIIPFKLWKYEILSQLYQSVQYEKITKSLNDFCKANNLTETIFDIKYNFTDDDIEQTIKDVRGYKDVLNKYKERKQLVDIDYCKEKIKDWARGREKIKELLQNKQAHYYLIEDWNNPQQFMVIMLRDVKRLDFTFAERMEKGISEKILEDEMLIRNDIFKTGTGVMVYKLQQVVKSPFLEHIMEAFSKNFCRIGIDRIDESVLGDLTDC
jgi:hypothetical protein